jgi:hypothetical protein
MQVRLSLAAGTWRGESCRNPESPTAEGCVAWACLPQAVRAWSGAGWGLVLARLAAGVSDRETDEAER